MTSLHPPPGNLKDFDRGRDPGALYEGWHEWLAKLMQVRDDFPAWYESLDPPTDAKPATAAPPWRGLPRTALRLNDDDVLASAHAVDAPWDFGSGVDPLNVTEPAFKRTDGSPFPGPKYRPQDEYLEWVTLHDPDGVVREVVFTCEGPEYWQFIADHDRDLLVELYADVLGVKPGDVDRAKLFFPETVTRREAFSARRDPRTFKKDSYNPYNEYNIAGAVHLTQGANTLGAEIQLAQDGSRIYGNPPKTEDPDLACCANYGEVNRASDPTIGKEVNDKARLGMYVTLRDPVGLYISGIAENEFTDWDGNPVNDLAERYLVATRKSDDGSLILHARFKVPDGVERDGRQARVGDLLYKGVPIETGGQVADAVGMHLFAQALDGAPAQGSQPCEKHPCFDREHPGYVIATPVGTPCGARTVSLPEHLEALRQLAPTEAAGAPTEHAHHTRRAHA